MAAETGRPIAPPPPRVALTRGTAPPIGDDVRSVSGKALAADRGLALIPPYDYPHVIGGQGTAALELFEETGALDALVVPVGGGGLIAGSATTAKALHLGAQVIGVEPEAGDDTKRSLESGERVTVPVPCTIADGQARTPQARSRSPSTSVWSTPSPSSATKKSFTPCGSLSSA
ncbi:hypothetical protein GCM10010310_77470 [Streptomyces violaceolatus]|uniref:Tryptophan synthase beta chain-like PALP domain-containing protein n=1 Tax=Streptomyces violaceolatus TaxID=67378 RepID=A0ABN3TK70_9ACTN